MLKGFLRIQCDGAIYLASLIPMSIFDPKRINEGLNPYRNSVQLSPEQQAAKRERDGKLMFARWKKFLGSMCRKKRRKPVEE